MGCRYHQAVFHFDGLRGFTVNVMKWFRMKRILLDGPSWGLLNEFISEHPELGSFNELTLCVLSHKSRLIGSKPPWWYEIELKVFIFERATTFFFSSVIYYFAVFHKSYHLCFQLNNFCLWKAGDHWSCSLGSIQQFL